MQRQKEIKVARTSWATEAQEARMLALACKKAQEARQLLKTAGCSCQALITWTVEHDVICTQCHKQTKHYFS